MTSPAPSYPPQMRLAAPSGPVQASVTIPGSKSITNRALLLAALADGTSRLRAPLHSDDTFYMAQCLRDLGVAVEQTPEGDFTVEGAGGAFAAPTKTLSVGNSGTTVRFLTAAACLAPAGTDVVLDGVARMRERPIRDLLGALLTLGVEAESVNGHGCPPVRVRGGGLPGGSCKLRGDVSSQFLSALLQVAPYAQRDVTIEIVGELISKPYIDITQSVMRSFGAELVNKDYRWLTVPAGQRYAAQDYAIEADASNASYFLAAAAVTGGTVTLENLSSESIQGDAKFVDVLERMGCRVTRGPQLSLSGPPRLSAVTADMDAMPDMAQTLALVCAFANGPSRITNLGSLRVKETDRVAAVAKELPKLGVRVEEGRDFWTITPPADGAYQSAAIDTY
ncbi:MAG: 3-phosphoshikimate 1-carboxyvinyltransferase, partial [Armatimonadota bacterium]|nr:3-phosphoshikimate 1-carboxyvinyltransferase [Armatimonadota bacterium]